MRTNRRSLYLVLVTIGACSARPRDVASTAAPSAQVTAQASDKQPSAIDSPRVVRVSNMTARTGESVPRRDTAMFAGGCFWSMERPFQHVPGVLATTVGYAGGHTKNPTYEQVNTRTTGHTETVLVEYDPAVVTYDKLLEVYWHNIDPITKDRQFCDGGSDYRTVIFTHGAAQQSAALAAKAALDKSGRFKVPVLTEVLANAPF